MKKNAMLKIAAILMVAVLLTTCAISSTFAKYATSDGVAVTSARVAKWGVDVTVTNPTNKLFGLEYGDADSLWVETSVDNEKVVAPGTTGSTPSFAVSGTTEVAVEIKATANVELENWYLDALEATPSDVYCPLAVTVGTDPALQIGDDETLEEFEARIEAAIVRALTGAASTDDVTYTESTSITTIAKSVAPNTDLDTTAVAVSWVWALGEASEDDTTLGTNALTSGKAATISVTYNVSVEQANTEAPSGVKA